MSDLLDSGRDADKYADLYRDGKTIIDFTHEQIIHHTYNRAKKVGDDELMRRIEKNWEDIFSVPYFESDPIPTALLGGPGQGKTAVMIAAAKQAAKFLGLNFVSDRTVMPTKNDFYFDVVTLGGALSPVDVKGTKLPADKIFSDQNGAEVQERVMNTVLPTNVTKAKYARTGFVLLDDAPNAHPDVLTAVYDLLKPESESEYANIYYSLTGNTGDDGAAAKKFNTAIFSRCRLMYMKDLPKDFIHRIENDYRNDVAETYIRSLALGFIMQNGNLLNTPPIKAQQEKTQFACSRTWTQFVQQLSQKLRPYAWKVKNKPEVIGEQGTAELLSMVQQLAVDNLGRDVGGKLYSHTLRVLQDADPIAREILEKGVVTDELKGRLANQYTTGETPSDMDFMYAMADALSNHAAERYVMAFSENDEQQQEKILAGFVTGLYDTLRSPKTPDYVMHCYQRFFSACVAKSNNNPSFGYKTDKGVMLIGNTFFGKVAAASSKHPVAVTEYENGLGRKVRLIDQMTNIGSIKAAMDGEIKALDEQNKALNDAYNRCAPKVSPAATVQPGNNAGAVTTAQAQKQQQPAQQAQAPVQKPTPMASGPMVTF